MLMVVTEMEKRFLYHIEVNNTINKSGIQVNVYLKIMKKNMQLWHAQTKSIIEICFWSFQQR